MLGECREVGVSAPEWLWCAQKETEMYTSRFIAPIKTIMTRLALCQYTSVASVCAQEWELSQPKPIQKSSPWSRHAACTFVCDTSGSELQRQPHWGNESTHANILLSSAMTIGSTSCKPPQDVSKRSREHIQSPCRPRLHFKTWPGFGEGQVIEDKAWT